MNQSEKLKRALHCACMGSMGLAASWRNQAHSAIQQGQPLNLFVAHAHPCNARKAKAAYLLASHELNQPVDKAWGPSLPNDFM